MARVAAAVVAAAAGDRGPDEDASGRGRGVGAAASARLRGSARDAAKGASSPLALAFVDPTDGVSSVGPGVSGPRVTPSERVYLMGSPRPAVAPHPHWRAGAAVNQQGLVANILRPSPCIDFLAAFAMAPKSAGNHAHASTLGLQVKDQGDDCGCFAGAARHHVADHDDAGVDGFT
jgi:hypothetical protein